MLDELLSYTWRDVQLLELSVDRAGHGGSDTIRLTVEWANWVPHPAAKRSVIEFSNCHRLEVSMSFGTLSGETIKNTWQEPCHPEIAKMSAGSGKRDLFCWAFQTSATGDMVKIIAGRVTITPIAAD